MKKALIIQRRMTGYRVPFFNKMRERLEHVGAELSVVYGTPMKEEVLRADGGELSWGIKIPCRYLPLGKSRIVYQPIPRKLLLKQDMIIIPHENRFLLNYLRVLLHRSSCASIAFFGHGANFQSRKKNGYPERLKAWTAQRADWWFAYTSLSRDRIVAGGFPSERVTCVNNSLDVASLAAWQKGLAPDELHVLRRTLGLKGDKVGVFLGSLYEDKLLGFLFQSLDRLREKMPDFELILIGDGPLRSDVKAFVRSRPWAFWVGAKQGREKVLHMSLGKVMLNPGLVGLNILDSFALGIPMLTTDCGLHSPEIAYLEPGRNGLMAPYDPDSYAVTAERLFERPDVMSGMAAACREDAERYSLDNMVENFCDGISLSLRSGRHTSK